MKSMSFRLSTAPVSLAHGQPMIGQPPLQVDDPHTSLPVLADTLRQLEQWNRAAASGGDVVMFQSDTARALLELAAAQVAGRIATVQLLTRHDEPVSDAAPILLSVGATSQAVQAATDRLIDVELANRAAHKMSLALRLFQAPTAKSVQRRA